MWLAINKALLVDGARQVGKTYLPIYMIEFLRQETI